MAFVYATPLGGWSEQHGNAIGGLFLAWLRGCSDSGQTAFVYRHFDEILETRGNSAGRQVVAWAEKKAAAELRPQFHHSLHSMSYHAGHNWSHPRVSCCYSACGPSGWRSTDEIAALHHSVDFSSWRPVSCGSAVSRLGRLTLSDLPISRFSQLEGALLYPKPGVPNVAGRT